MIDIERLHRNVTKNFAYYEYNLTNKTISVFFNDALIIENKLIEESFSCDEFVVNDDSKKDILDFRDLVTDSFSKEQMAFKAKHNGIERWYLVSTFPRNKNENIVCGTIENVSSFLVEQDKLVELSKTDSLTGLLNKTNTDKFIEKLIEERGFFMVCMIDLDYFKTINDTYGHMYGDKVIVNVSNILKQIAGTDGNVGRIGGDEFVLVKRIDHSPSNEERRNLCRQIKSAFIDSKGNDMFTSKLTTTIGLVVYPFDGTTLNDLYSHVDKALYRGKYKGRNCYVIYNEQMHGSINTQKPIQDVAMEAVNGTADMSIFINDVLGGILSNISREKALSKLVDISMYFRIGRITIYENKNNNFELIHKYEYEKNFYDTLTFNDVKLFLSQFDEGVFVASDVYEYKNDRKEKSKCMNIPYDHGSIVIASCGIRRNMDYIFALEIIGRRRIWNNNQIMSIKILAKMIMLFYLKG